jgi:hypothetical protein
VISGAAAGALVHPWLGSALGGALGGLMVLLRRESTLRERTLNIVSAALERSLERVMVRFGRFVAEPLEAERLVIEIEQNKLAQLERVANDVRAHVRELERLLEVAAQGSVGFCR